MHNWKRHENAYFNVNLALHFNRVFLLGVPIGHPFVYGNYLSTFESAQFNWKWYRSRSPIGCIYVGVGNLFRAPRSCVSLQLNTFEIIAISLRAHWVTKTLTVLLWRGTIHGDYIHNLSNKGVITKLTFFFRSMYKHASLTTFKSWFVSFFFFKWKIIYMTL